MGVFIYFYFFCDFPVSDGLNRTVTAEPWWPEAEKWLLVALLGLEASVGVTANSLVLLVKVMVRCRSFLFLKIWNKYRLFSKDITYWSCCVEVELFEVCCCVV